MVKITITQLPTGMQNRLETAIADVHGYQEQIRDPNALDFIPDPLDPSREIRNPNTLMPNPQTKWEFVEEVLLRILSESLGQFDAEKAVEGLASAARDQAKTDLLG